MLNKSRIDIYNYLYNLFFETVTENVYSMNEPQELTPDDTNDGFIVIRVGDVIDDSEFSGEAYGHVRCYVEAFVPPISRGRLDVEKYKAFEDSINDVIAVATMETGGEYHVREDSVISMDGDVASTANNTYFSFIKSFIVDITQIE